MNPNDVAELDWLFVVDSFLIRVDSQQRGDCPRVFAKLRFGPRNPMSLFGADAIPIRRLGEDNKMQHLEIEILKISKFWRKKKRKKIRNSCN